MSKARGLVILDNEACRRQRAALRTPAAQGLAERVMDLVAAVTRGQGYTAGTVQLLGELRGTTRRLRAGLHAALAGAGADELNYVLTAVNAPALLEVVAPETVTVLVRGRVAALTTVSRSVLVDAFQKLGLRHRTSRQAAVRDVLLATRGLDLTRLKAYIDDGGDYHSCYKLMYNDLQVDWWGGRRGVGGGRGLGRGGSGLMLYGFGGLASMHGLGSWKLVDGHPMGRYADRG